jgi:hypothetical protein
MKIEGETLFQLYFMIFLDKEKAFNESEALRVDLWKPEKEFRETVK